ncbi:MAG TPA: hypothetical protein VGH08_04665 [Chthoniobacterales bacterium]|jgi:UDP-N-acetylmuramyl tripeptide synthase
MAGSYTTIVRGTNGKTDGLMEAFTKNPELDLVIGFTGGASGGTYGEYSNMKTTTKAISSTTVPGCIFNLADDLTAS